MSLMLLGILNSQAAGGSIAYYIQTLGGSGDELGRGAASDSDNNLHVAGFTKTDAAGHSDFLVVKYDAVGDIVWQRRYGGNLGYNGQDEAEAIGLDSSGNVYVSGVTRAGAGNTDGIAIKYNSSGTIQWQNAFGGSDSDYYRGMAIDSSGNQVAVGETANSTYGSWDGRIVGMNSSGSVQFQRRFGGSGQDFLNDAAFDSSGNSYVVGETSESSGASSIVLAKSNSGGTLQWQRYLTGSGAEYGESVTVDSSDNVYVLGTTDTSGAGGQDALLAKYNTSGTLQWQRILGGSGTEYAKSVSTDTDGNIFIAGFTNSDGAGDYDGLIAKYNSSGTIQWQRTLGTTGSDSLHGMTVGADGAIYVTGKTDGPGAGAEDLFLAKLPNDGSLTGNYTLDSVTVKYEASTLTAATSSLASETGGLSNGSSSMSSTGLSQASNTSSYTQYKVIL